MYIVARQIKEDMYVQYDRCETLEEAQLSAKVLKEFTKYNDVCILEE